MRKIIVTAVLLVFCSMGMAQYWMGVPTDDDTLEVYPGKWLKADSMLVSDVIQFSGQIRNSSGIPADKNEILYYDGDSFEWIHVDSLNTSYSDSSAVTAYSDSAGTVADGTVDNAAVATDAAIAGTKINPDFGTQDIITEGAIYREYSGEEPDSVDYLESDNTVFTLDYPLSVYPFTNSKRGGFCFRVDDIADTEDKIKWSKVFDKYGYKSTWAINSYDLYGDADAIADVKDYQQRGHELLDHTPNHRTEWFKVLVMADTSLYSGVTGVDSIRASDGTVYLTRAFPDTSTCLQSTTIRTIADTDTFRVESGDNLPNQLGYVYNPADDTWYNYIYVDASSARIFYLRENTTFASSDTVDFYFTQSANVTLTKEATLQLFLASIRQFQTLGLNRPYFWVQPGGSHANIDPDSAKWAAERCGYIGGETTRNVRNFTTYNDTDSRPEWRTYWGDFSLFSRSLYALKTGMTNAQARNELWFGSNHFRSWGADYDAATDALKFEQFLMAVDSTLSYFRENNYVVGRYCDWIPTLFFQTPNPYQNIIPDIFTDADGNSTPDGYVLDGGAWASSGGLESDHEYCFTISSADTVFYIEELGAIEKGWNDFSLYLSGASGDTVQVVVDPDSGSTTTLTFAANDGSLSQKTGQVNIDKSALYADIYVICSAYSSGTVKVGGLEMQRAAPDNTMGKTIKPDVIAIGSGVGSQTIYAQSETDLNIRFETSGSGDADIDFILDAPTSEKVELVYQSDGDYKWRVKREATNSNFQIYSDTQSSYALVIEDATGDVGINNAFPSAKLDIVADASAGGNALEIRNSDDVYCVVVKDSGSVGIRTDSPTSTLDVNGSTRIRSYEAVASPQKGDIYFQCVNTADADTIRFYNGTAWVDFISD